MARDAQLAGDRVQAEYYLQFADHYFRVLGESQARFNEQRRQRGEDPDEDGDGDDSDMDSNDGDYESNDERQERPEREDRPTRQDRPERQDRSERPERTVRAERQDRPELAARNDRPARVEDSERPAPRPRRDTKRSEQVNGGETISFDVLPPAIGADSTGGEVPLAEDSPRPRRRPRAVRPAGGDDDVAPSS